ncbi:B3 domain-containing transcription factor VRN1-like isoform X3 [Manihot esculenta]|uniref:TF-B3 domain-containing protein n=1 Tax=Manihot esculenta TaxID=3983 RepID=A0A2C9URL1_MANES|nr:B3 domain-containing transcription factor VRN1-like isoform X3 [Manihot esculenta]
MNQEIPKKFIRKHGKDLPSPVILKVANGSIWKIELSKCHGEVWLEKGWQEFAKHHSLDHGYFLVFKYEGHGHFCVFILDKSASEIQYPCEGICTADQKPEPVVENNEDGFSVEIMDDPSQGRKAGEMSPLSPHQQSCKRTRTDPTAKTLDSMFCSSTEYLSNKATPSTCIKVESSICSKGFGGMLKQLTGSKKDACRKRTRSDSKALANANKFVSSNPFFKSVVWLDKRKNSIVCVPVSFSRRNIKDCVANLTLQFGDRLWPVKLIRYSKWNVVRFCSGWSVFARENSLEMGDVCIFELIKIDVLNVYIFKCDK